MATGSFSQPPTFAVEPGIVPSFTNQAGSVGSTVIFTAQVGGLYSIAALEHILSTNGDGTLAVPVTGPNGFSVTIAATAVTADSRFADTPLWLNAGQQVSASVTAAGVTGTNFNVLFPISQLL